MSARSPRVDAPRVLAFADVAGSYVAAWRVHGPLEALKRSGEIADFVVTDACLRGIPPRKSFDVIHEPRFFAGTSGGPGWNGGCGFWNWNDVLIELSYRSAQRSLGNPE